MRPRVAIALSLVSLYLGASLSHALDHPKPQPTKVVTKTVVKYKTVTKVDKVPAAMPQACTDAIKALLETADNYASVGAATASVSLTLQKAGVVLGSPAELNQQIAAFRGEKNWIDTGTTRALASSQKLKEYVERCRSATAP